MKNKKNLLSSNIQFLMASRGMTQKEFGQYMGWSTATVNNYINGKAEPKVPKLIALADKFEIAIDDLLTSDLSKKKRAVESSAEDDRDLLISLLSKEVRRLREQIERTGSKEDKERADAALDEAIEGLEEDKKNGK